VGGEDTPKFSDSPRRPGDNPKIAVSDLAHGRGCQLVCRSGLCGSYNEKAWMKLFELRPRQAAWRRSSFCATGECAEIGRKDDKILMRSSLAPRVVVRYSPEEFRALVQGIRAGEFDDLASH
jgi:hypothetical protein